LVNTEPDPEYPIACPANIASGNGALAMDPLMDSEEQLALMQDASERSLIVVASADATAAKVAVARVMLVAVRCVDDIFSFMFGAPAFLSLIASAGKGRRA